MAKCLYADVKWDKDKNTVYITSGKIPYYDGQGLPNRDELFEQMKTWHQITGPLTRVGETVAEPTAKKPEITKSFKPTGVMTSAPETGTILAKIMLPGKTDIKSNDSYYEPYKINIGHGCNWYAFGRFYETYGWQVPVDYTGGKTYIGEVEKSATYVKAEYDFNKIISGCIAVYWREKNGGHVVFVEYVERDENDNPVNVYYTECMNTNGSGYKPKTDGKIKKATFERFKKSSSGKKDLMGFVVPNIKE